MDMIDIASLCGCSRDRAFRIEAELVARYRELRDIAGFRRYEGWAVLGDDGVTLLHLLHEASQRHMLASSTAEDVHARLHLKHRMPATLGELSRISVKELELKDDHILLLDHLLRDFGHALRRT